MKPSLFVSILIHFVVFTGFSQSTVWTIEGNGTKMYVGGSIHILREQDYPLPKEFQTAFEKSEILVLEVDVNFTDKKELSQKMMGLTLYPNNKSLKTELSEDIYRKLDSVCTKSGIPLEKMNGFKPVFTILMLTQFELIKIGVSSKGVDEYFLNKATKTGKKVLSLESVDYQMKLLTRLGDGNQNEYVLHSINELNYYRDYFVVALESWRNGDTVTFINQILEYKEGFPELYEKLLLTRNNNWIPHLESYLETPEVEYVLVGALHLYGPDGILQQMRQKGYKVEQL